MWAEDRIEPKKKEGERDSGIIERAGESDEKKKIGQQRVCDSCYDEHVKMIEYWVCY